MIQRTLITNNLEELTHYVDELKSDPIYAAAGDRILIFSDQNGNPSHLREEVSLIRSFLPDIRIVGLTMPGSGMTSGGRDSSIGVYTFLLMERSRIDMHFFDCKTTDIHEAGKLMRREIRYKEHVAGVLLASAGVEREIDKFITAVDARDRSDIPLLGAQAGASATPYICGTFCDDTVSNCGIVAMVFYGRGLQFYYNYDMGWKAIGKEMTVTKTDGNYCIETIDDMPATSIYKDYLGVETDEYFVENVREFPLITKSGDRQVVRTPWDYDDKGRLHFIAKVNEGDILRFSYGNQRRLLEETKMYADSANEFGPQALLLIICENRARFLADQASVDILNYRSFMPHTAWVRAFAAVMFDKMGGGVVNSAILSIGMREGAPKETDINRPMLHPADVSHKGATPLDQRLAMFLERTTQELEDMAIAADAANAAKSEFLSQMSHEIRTPINAILGMNEMILRESDNETVLKYAENARAAGMSLLNIISDILDFSKIEAGKMDIVPSEYELASLINDLVNLIRHRADEKGLELTVAVDPDTPHQLFGDEIRVKQIITNLLSNAVKYTERGTVTMSITHEKTGPNSIKLHVSVSDTGIGIRKENLHKLFLAFDRIDKNRARKIEGTGLGLNITRQLLGLMNSELKVESVYGEGSTFSFKLDQQVTDWDVIGDYNESVKRIQKKHIQRGTRFTAEKAHILVVDDAPMNIDVISGLLRRTLIQVDTANSGLQCIDKVSANDYDMIFLDHRMPGMDGIETLERLKSDLAEKLEGVPIISLTANAVAGAREIYIEAGFSDYLTKPVMVNELEDMLQKYLPEDKILYQKADDAVPTEEEVELPAFLSEINLLDVEKGLSYCGGTGEYIDALQIFASSIELRSNELEDDFKSKDWNNYTIRIHALKSMTKSIGAVDLSELAASLEEAGKSGDIAAIDAGTTVFLELYRSLREPLEQLSVPRPKVTTFSEIGEDAYHILLVDDDSDYLSLVGRWLKKDYRVSTIGSGEQALTYLQTETPDLILLDYAMPEMSGVEVLEQIRSNPETESLPVIFLTGTEDRKIVKAAEALKPEGFLLKSMGKSDLLMAVKHFFAE